MALAGGMGSYNYHDLGEEVECRPLLFYANPLGHHILATLQPCQKVSKKQSRMGAQCVCGAMCGAHSAHVSLYCKTIFFCCYGLTIIGGRGVASPNLLLD